MDTKTSENKGTIYQQLNKLFNFDGFGFENQNDIRNNQGLNNFQNTKIIIKGNSPEDIYKKGLELQQQKELINKFKRVTDRGFQKALQYEAARLPAYVDYEGMEFYPLISSALDLYMEEATTIGDNGKMLNIYSNKERIKNILEDFFYNIVNVNVNLPFWTRNTAKYGDNFVLMYGERKKGITHVKQLVNYEIERFERVIDGKPVVKFKERMTGDEFNIFEIAHFRLLGDDKYLPYGSSILNKIRRVFRQLIMAEDAMLTYRIIRAGEKKVFKIDVGNMDEDDIENYIYKVATKFKRAPQISPNDGQIDYRFNILGNDEDYYIPVRNGNVQTGIDTLPGASNLDAIQDIEYLRDNLFSGLGIPKPFLSFQDASGAGKNMAQYDIRFAKKVNRIQQAMIQELNKMAIIHLYLLGFTGEDLNNFKLTLTNPSTQLDLLKSQLLREKAQTYSELTRGENGIAAMSHTRAKRLIFNMSDSEIVEDLKQQKMEKVVMQELADAPVIIKKSGLFVDIDNKYGEPDENLSNSGNTNNMGDELPNSNIGGGLPNNSIGGELPNTEMGGGLPSVNTGGETSQNSEPTAGGETAPQISEEKNKFNYNDYIEKLVYGTSKEHTVKDMIDQKLIIEETNNIVNNQNITVNSMINEIDNLIKKTQSFNTEHTDNNDAENIDWDDLDDIEI